MAVDISVWPTSLNYHLLNHAAYMTKSGNIVETWSQSFHNYPVQSKICPVEAFAFYLGGQNRVWARWCLPCRNNGQVLQYWLWLWKRDTFISLSPQVKAEGWLLCLLCLCSADLGCFPNYASRAIVFWHTLEQWQSGRVSILRSKIPALEAATAVMTQLYLSTVG